MSVMSQKYPERSTAKHPSQLSEGSKIALLSHCSPASLTSSTRVIRLREVNSPRRSTHTWEKDSHSRTDSYLGEGLSLRRRTHTQEGLALLRRTHVQEKDSYSGERPEVAQPVNQECRFRRFRVNVECRAHVSPLSSIRRAPRSRFAFT